MGDFNSDGHLDWVVSNGEDNTLWLYLGHGDGTASMPTIIPLKGLAPLSITAVNLRGNGTLDLVVAEADSGTVGVLLGNGDGTFQPEVEYQLTVSPFFVLGGDFNSDGKLDIAVGLNGTAQTGSVAVLPGDGQGHLGTPLYNPAAQPSNGFWLAAGDVRGDGKLDLIVVDPFDLLPHGGAEIYLNNGNGTFSAGQLVYFPTGDGTAFSAALVDLNNDGCADAVVTDSFGLVWVDSSNCDGTFNLSTSGYALGDIAATLQLVDLNGDGKLDIVTSGALLEGAGGPGIGDQAGNLISVLFGDGAGHFSPGGVYRGEPTMVGMAVGDLNGDGFPDVVTANQGSNSASVFLNDKKGGFGDPQGEAVGYGSGTTNSPDGQFVIADVDGNGTPDIVFLQLPPLYPGTEQITSLLNDGTGKFSAPIRSPLWNTGTNLNPGGFVLADFRNTGRPDALVLAGSIIFAPNIGGGKFGPYTMTGEVGAGGPAAVGDFNGDGKLDFVTVSPGIGYYNSALNLSVFLGNGDGTFRAGQNITFETGVQYISSSRVYAGDFNRDGKLDALVLLGTNFTGGLGGAGLYELLGNGDGTFQPARLLFPDFGTFGLADVNHDGWPDIVAIAEPNGDPAIYVPTVSVFLGQADGTFIYSTSYTPYLDSVRPPYDFGGAIQYFPFEALLGDFNADGNPDVAVFQTPPGSPQSFVQILYGNGDGTFTPTYAAYGLNKIYVPEFAVDLNGDGATDLIEQDNNTSSFNVLKSVPGAPALQLQILNTPLAGGTGYGTVTLSLASTSATVVSLIASDPHVVLPSVTIPAGSVSQQFQFSISGGFNPATVFTIQGQVGSATAIAYGYMPSVTMPVVEIEPTALLFGGVNSGDSSDPKTLTVSNIGNAPLAITEFSVLGYGFKQTNDCGSTLAVGGNCAVQVTYTAGGLGAEGATLQLFSAIGISSADLEGFSLGLAITPSCCLTFAETVGTTSAPQTAVLTNQQTSPIQITMGAPGQGFSQTNDCGTLAPSASCRVNATFTPSQTGGPVNVSIAVTVNGQNNNQYGIGVMGYGSDFQLNTTVGSDTVKAGQSATYQLTAESLYGFASSVSLSCSGAPQGAKCSVSPTSVNVPLNQTSSFEMTVTTTAPSTSALTYPSRKKYLPPGKIFWALAGTVMVGCIVCGSRRFSRITATVSLFLILIMCSCGGGSATGNGTPPGGSPPGGTPPGGSSSGTPAGTYLVTVKGVSEGASHSMKLSLTVQ
jgi:hypothetical protein